MTNQLLNTYNRDIRQKTSMQVHAATGFNLGEYIYNLKTHTQQSSTCDKDDLRIQVARRQ